MRTWIFIIIIATAISSHAVAGWCLEGTGIAITGELKKKHFTEIVTEIRKKCKEGDSVGIPSGMVGAIGEVCDFNKAIFFNPTSGSKYQDPLTMCVVGK